MLVSKQFTFDAAHYLTKYHGKCENLHGHTYRLQVTVNGEIKDDGMVVDFVELKNLVKEKIISKFDHQNLNDFFENPSAELIAEYIWGELKSEIKGAQLHEITLWETADSFVTCNDAHFSGTRN